MYYHAIAMLATGKDAVVVNKSKEEVIASFVVPYARDGVINTKWGGRTMTLTVNGRNLTNAYQRDLDQGPLRDAAYVYGPRFPRSIAVGLRFAL